MIGYKYALDERILDRLVFERINTLQILSSVGSLQTDLFKSFTNLLDIQVEMDSLRNFFHKIGVAWTVYLPGNAAVAFSNSDDGVSNRLNGQLYTYPSKDFCIFSDFPHQNEILHILDSGNLVNCTGTIAWLILH
jgi:hypothetical protein